MCPALVYMLSTNICLKQINNQNQSMSELRPTDIESKFVLLFRKLYTGDYNNIF
jgi:hypothetical protein